MTEKREPLCSYFAFYPSYYETITKYVPEGYQLKALKAFIEYGLYGVEPSEDLPDMIRAMFDMARPTIDKHLRVIESDRKGGRPPKKEDEKNGENTGANTKTEKDIESGDSIYCQKTKPSFQKLPWMDD